MAGTETDAPPVDRTEGTLDSGVEVAPRPRSLWWYSWRRLRRNRRAIAGLCIVALLVLVAVFADLIVPMDPNRQILEYSEKPSGFRGNVLVVRNEGSSYGDEYLPVERYRIDGDSVRFVDMLGRDNVIARSSLVSQDEAEFHREPVYLLGADKFGRDVLSRLIEGAQISLLVGFSAEIIALLIGVTLGALAGYYRGWVDAAVMYLANVIWSFPFILLVIAFSLALGHGLWQSFIAIGIASWVDVCRIVRGQFFSLRETEYVEATRALGFGSVRTIFRHMLPNAMGPITVIATAGFASAIIAEASLSYLGLGVQPPQASWGQMIRDGYGYISAGKNWSLAIYPSVAIALAVFGFNMLGDGLRDALDPKMRT